MAARNKLTDKQKGFIKSIKRKAPDGVPTSKDIVEAVLENYDVGQPGDPNRTLTQKASTMGGQLLRNPKIAKQLGLKDLEQDFFSVVKGALNGTDQQHPGDRELKRTAINVLSRHFVPAKSEETVQISGMEARSDEDLAFFAEHGCWPEDMRHPTVGEA